MKKDHPVTYAKRAISLAMLGASQPKDAVAAEFTDYLGMKTSVLHCPKDNNGGISYGLHKVFDGTSDISAIDMFDYCAENNEVIIADSDQAFISRPTDCIGRHGSTTLHSSRQKVVFTTASGVTSSGDVHGKFKVPIETDRRIQNAYRNRNYDTNTDKTIGSSDETDKGLGNKEEE